MAGRRAKQDWADQDMGFDEADMRRKLSEVADWLRDQVDTPRPHLRAVTPDFEPPRPRPDEHILDEILQRRLAAQWEREQDDSRMRDVMGRFAGPIASRQPLRSAVAEIVQRQRYLDNTPSYEAPPAPPQSDPLAARMADMEAAFERIAARLEPRPAETTPRRDPVTEMEAALEKLASQFEQRTGQTFQAIEASLQDVQKLMQQARDPVEAAEAAATEIVHSRLQLMATATHERIDKVARDLAELRADSSDAEKRMRDVMDTVRLTLEHMTGRLPAAAAAAPEPNLSMRARAAAQRAMAESLEAKPVDPQAAPNAPERRSFIAAARRSTVPPEPRIEQKSKYTAPAPPPRQIAPRLREVAADTVQQPPRPDIKRILLAGGAAAALLIGIFAGSSSLLDGMFEAHTETASLEPQAMRTEPAATAPAPEMKTATAASDSQPAQLFEPPAEPASPTSTFTPSEPLYTGSVPPQPAETPLVSEAPPAPSSLDLASATPRPVARPAAPQAAAGLPAEIGGAKLRTQAAAGDANAQYEVGVRFAEGRGVARDQQKAAVWLERAARQGLAPAQYRFARLAEKGDGIAKDVMTARRYYEQASAAGNIQAMHNLGVMYAEGAFGAPDLATALNWFRKAAEYGVRDSQFNLGIFYARGISVAKDPAESYLWFSLAAAQGDKDSAAKRDQVGAKLDGAKLAAVKAQVARWTAKVAPAEANTPAAPAEGWDTAGTASGRASAPLN